MFTIFFKSTVHISFLERGETLDHKTYIDQCLKPMLSTFKKERPLAGLKNMKVLHDNARAHVHKNVINLLNTESIAIIDHLPYSSM
jgi:hypothetical protein